MKITTKIIYTSVFLTILVLLIKLLYIHTNISSNSTSHLVIAKDDDPYTYETPILKMKRPVDTTIKNDQKNNFKNTTNNFQTYFKSNPLTKNAIRFKSKNSEISFYTQKEQDFGNLNSGIPSVFDNTITYGNIYKNISLKYTVTETRLLEEFIVNDNETAQLTKNISQYVNLKNINRYEESDGSIKFFNKNEDLIFTLPKPVLYEQKNNQNKSYGIEYQIIEIDKNTLIIKKVITDEGVNWLNNSERIYPIVIDLVIDNADTSSNWVSSNSNLLTVAQETTIKQEGTGSVKLTPTASWYNFSWPYRTKLTIESDNVNANLTDFPVYVDLNDLPAAFHSHVNQTDARDIRITKSDGTTELPREVVFYNSSTDTGEVHFQYTGTLSSSTDTDIYIYYGNASATDYGATDTYGRNNVWDDNYIGVYHLNESSGTHYSSTGSYDSTTVAVTQQGANIGKLYTADEFASTNDISFADNDAYSVNTTNAFTAEAWVYLDSLAARTEPLNKGASNNYEWGVRIETNGSLRGEVYTPTGGAYLTAVSTASQITTATWYHLALSTNISTPRTDVFKNGVSLANATTPSGSYGNGTAAMRIGERADGGNDTDGIIDEVRFSNIARGASWLLTQYNNQSAPETFFNSFGTEETITSQTATHTVSSTDLSSYDSITYWVRSDRTGSFMRFQFGELASNEQTNSITINSANTWEQKTWNISGIPALDRNAVTKYAFEVTDASTNFNFYFDDIQASVNNSAPATPSLDTPTDTATNQSLTPALKTTTTDADSDYLRYKIELCENVGMTTNCSTFDQTVSQTGWSGQDAQTSTAYASGTQATYTIQSALSPATTYYWRSYAIDPGGSNTWSSTQGTPYSFTTTTAPSAPGTPYAEGASNPTGIVDLTPEFSAVHSDSDSDPAVYYEIEVNTASNFGGTVMWDTGQTSMSSLASGVRSSDVSYAGSSLSYNGNTYYWRIRFWDNKGAVSNWTLAQSFSTNSIASTPSLDSPADTATNQSLTPALKTTTTDADSDYLRYKIELCENVGMSTNCQTFDQTVSQTGWSGQDAQTSTAYASGTQATYTIQSALSASTTYYWRSYAIDPGGTNTWSSTQGTPYSFTTLSGENDFKFKGLNLKGINLQ